MINMTYLVNYKQQNQTPSIFDDFDQFFKLGFPALTGEPLTSNQTVAGELSEDEDNYYATLEVPGVDKNELSINIQENILTIAGEKKNQQEEQNKKYHYTDISYGKFQRRFKLPVGIDTKKTQADYQNGVLQITVPKAESSKPREIKIEIK